MKLSLFGKNKKVLLVGEGNFSFAVTLVKHNLGIYLTATCFENSWNKIGQENIDFLISCGIRVLFGVDATKLNEHKILNLESFDIIVFNFPHVGENNGQVFITLCDGQGGTPADNNRREWNNSWQITEMAAYSNFALIAVEPFDSLLFESYTVTGYRSLEKQFNTKRSITHIFKLFKKPNIDNIAPKQKIKLKSEDKLVDLKDIIEHNNITSIVQNESTLSLYPNCYKFDITLLINPEFNNVKLYEILYNYAGLVISNIEYLGFYQFPDLKQTRTFRITYKSNQFPLHRKLSINLHNNVITKIIKKYLNVSVSK